MAGSRFSSEMPGSSTGDAGVRKLSKLQAKPTLLPSPDYGRGTNVESDRVQSSSMKAFFLKCFNSPHAYHFFFEI